MSNTIAAEVLRTLGAKKVTPESAALIVQEIGVSSVKRLLAGARLDGEAGLRFQRVLLAAAVCVSPSVESALTDLGLAPTKKEIRRACRRDPELLGALRRLAMQRPTGSDTTRILGEFQPPADPADLSLSIRLAGASGALLFELARRVDGSTGVRVIGSVNGGDRQQRGVKSVTLTMTEVLMLYAALRGAVPLFQSLAVDPARSGSIRVDARDDRRRITFEHGGRRVVSIAVPMAQAATVAQWCGDMLLRCYPALEGLEAIDSLVAPLKQLATKPPLSAPAMASGAH